MATEFEVNEVVLKYLQDSLKHEAYQGDIVQVGVDFIPIGSRIAYITNLHWNEGADWPDPEGVGYIHVLEALVIPYASDEADKAIYVSAAGANRALPKGYPVVVTDRPEEVERSSHKHEEA